MTPFVDVSNPLVRSLNIALRLHTLKERGRGGGGGGEEREVW